MARERGVGGPMGGTGRTRTREAELRSGALRRALLGTTRLALAAIAALTPAAARAQVRALPGYLSGPSSAAPLERAVGLLRERPEELGLERADVENAALATRRRNPRTGVEHFFFRQHLNGLEVVGGELGVSVDARGRVLARWSRAVSGLERAAPPPVPLLGADAAISRAAAYLGLAPAERSLAPVEVRGGAAREAVFEEPAYSSEPIPVKLVFRTRPGGGVALAWDTVLRVPGADFWGDVFVDARSGDVVDAHSWIDHDSYRVFAQPLVDPEHGERDLAADPADALASPFGWHDTNGAAGAEFTDTRGNNALAQEDVDGNDVGGTRPSSLTLDFDFPLDLTQVPSGYVPAAIANLFYWNNVAHDVFYQYGFDEASGNFQTNNYGNGGLAGDAVRADAQDGSDVNNAGFGTPPDGSAPRMEMYVWTLDSGRVTVSAPASLAGALPAGVAQFGPPLDTVGVTGTVVQALDPATGTLPSDTDGCSALTNAGAVFGNVAIVDRGECNFSVKVKNCQDAGAIAVIVVNNQGDALVEMSGSDPTIVIPSLFLGQSDGEAIGAQLASGVTATLHVLVNRDSDLDSGVIVHEYGHGVTNRLTGGPANVLCLDTDQSGGMGEGWSDFFALAFTARAEDTDVDPRPIAAYVTGNPVGLRTWPYSTDLAVDPLTFEDIEILTVPHGVGEVWAVTLWEAYWNLVHAYGFDPDLYAGQGGNNRALGLVIDALSLQPCDPSFLDARDALLQADLAATGGADACLLWDAFARRGLGASASDQSTTSIAVTESFDVPAECAAYCGDGVVQAPEACDDGNRIDFDGCHGVCLLEDSFTLAGTAQGGSVSITLEGVLVTVTTSAGQSAADALAALAAAIGADPTLSALGVSSRVEGTMLVTGGTITGVSIDDPGFAPAVPGLPLAARALLVALIVLAGARRRTQR